MRQACDEVILWHKGEASTLLAVFHNTKNACTFLSSSGFCLRVQHSSIFMMTPAVAVDENQGMTRHGSLLSKEAALEQWEDRKKLQKRVDSLKTKLKVGNSQYVPHEQDNALVLRISCIERPPFLSHSSAHAIVKHG